MHANTGASFRSQSLVAPVSAVLIHASNRRSMLSTIKRSILP